MQYTVRTILNATAAVALWFACVFYGVRIGGAGGGAVSGVASGIALVFSCVALWCIPSRKYVAASLLLFAALVTATFGYYTLEFHAVFAAPEIRLEGNFRNLNHKLRENNGFKNVDSRIQREAMGGCIILTGVVDSKQEMECLSSLCASYGHNTIENRVRIRAEVK